MHRLHGWPPGPQLVASAGQRLVGVWENGLPPSLTESTMSNPLMRSFATYLAACGRPQSTITLRLYQLRRLAESYPDLLSVTSDDLLGWLASQSWCGSTRNSYRSALRTFYGWAVDAGHLQADPTRRVPRAHVPPAQPRPCPDEVWRAAIIGADPRTTLMLRLAAGCGLRRAEIAGVASEHVARGVDGGWTLRVLGKGSKVRYVPLTDSMAAAIRAHGPGWCFPSPQGGHLGAIQVGKLISRQLPTGWTAHTLRHRFASAAYAHDRDLRAVQELLGHASVVTTQIYTRVPEGAARRAAEAAAA